MGHSAIDECFNVFEIMQSSHLSTTWSNLTISCLSILVSSSVLKLTVYELHLSILVQKKVLIRTTYGSTSATMEVSG